MLPSFQEMEFQGIAGWTRIPWGEAGLRMCLLCSEPGGRDRRDFVAPILVVFQCPLVPEFTEGLSPECASSVVLGKGKKFFHWDQPNL